jgi:hypothetical protein
MTKPLSRLLAAALVFAPASAWAHGDHEGAHGAVHLLTSFGHYGLMLLGAAGAALFGRRLLRLTARRREEDRNDPG